ncbi:hypothetical protein [Hydrogenophaga sp.]|uniref:hypothetical protein n=1 Tax=Hydrogenophaga sp. TaxID=1904254 RepID=UPI0026350411|nr:hypothetical protein [Hydrogenophaga sp.]MCW5654711.1 hypothetical protein [Hydrogenophaga sp.]
MTPEPLPSSQAPHPQAEAIRVAALQASWRRDRQVGRRRLALRWLAWAFWRYGLALLLVLAFAAAVGLWVHGASRPTPAMPRFLVLPHTPATVEPPAQPPRAPSNTP